MGTFFTREIVTAASSYPLHEQSRWPEKALFPEVLEKNDHAFLRKVVPASQPHLVWATARFRLPSTPPPIPQPSGGRDARAVESCRWLGHHWLMPGTRSGEYAHLAVRPGDSGPDMEREGGHVCVSRVCKARWTLGDRPFSHLHHQLRGLHPPLAPPSASSTPPLAGSPWKLLIALRQPGVKLVLPEQGL